MMANTTLHYADGGEQFQPDVFFCFVYVSNPHQLWPRVIDMLNSALAAQTGSQKHFSRQLVHSCQGFFFNP